MIKFINTTGLTGLSYGAGNPFSLVLVFDFITIELYLFAFIKEIVQSLVVLKLNEREERINATNIISMHAWEELALTARPVTDTDQCKC